MKIFNHHLIGRIGFALLVIVCSGTAAFSQNSVSIGSETIKGSAILYLEGNGSQGLILPIVTNVSGISSPEAGMIVYQSSDNQIYYHDGSSWSAIGSGGGGSDSQTLTLNGNTLTISNGNSVSLAGVAPTSAGQLFSWDGSQWTSTSSTPPTNGQVLQWNGSNWAPATIAGGTAYTAGSGISIDGSNVISNTGDADNDPTNELNTGVAVSGNEIQVTDAGGTVSAQISAVAPTSGQVLKWNGSAWEAGLDAEGTGSAPTLSNGELMIGNGSTNSAGTVSGDLTLSGANFTIANDAVTSAKILDGSISDADIANVAPGKLTQAGALVGQVLQWNGTSWVPVTVAVSAITGLSDLTDANVSAPSNGQILVYNNSNSRFENVNLSGDATLSNTGAMTLANSGVSAGTYPKVTVDAKGRVTSGAALVVGDVPDITMSKVTDAGALATLDEVNSSQIADGSIQAADLNDMGAGVNQVLQWNGTAWVPATVAGGGGTDDQQLTYNAGTNILSIEDGNTVDLSDLQQGLSVVAAGTSRNIDITDGAGIVVDVADNDNDATNEIQSLSLAGSDVTLSNGGGTVSVNDADADATNELVSGVAVSGNEIQVTDAGGTQSALLSGLAPSSGQVLKWNGTAWEAAADDVGGGGLPGLANAQIVTNDGSTNIPVTVGGDLEMDNTGSFNILNLQGSALSIGAPVSGQVLKWDGAQWAPAADDVGGGGLPGLTNAQIVTNDGSSNVAVTVSGDVTLANDGTVTIQADAVNSAKIADGSITNADIADVDNSKVTGLGALALLGSVGSTEITDGAVTSADIANGTIANIDILDVDPSKILQAGATNGQVLKWDGAQWAPANEAGGGGIPALGNAQLVTNNGATDVAVTVSGDVTFANDGTVTIAANAVNSAKIADGSITNADILDVDNSKVTGLGALALLSSVSSSEITDGSIMGADINQMGAASGEVLSWNGTTWAPSGSADGSATNELNTNFQVNAGNLEITDPGGTLSVPLTSIDTDDQNAGEVVVTPAGNLGSTDVQAALQELQTDIDGLGGDVSPTNELNTNFQVNAGNLEITDSGGTLTVPLTSIDTDDQTGAEVSFNNATSGLTATDVQAAIDEIDATIDALPPGVSQLNDLSDATVGAAGAGEILVGDGAVYNNVGVSGDVSLDAAGTTAIQTSAGNNVVDAINDAGTSSLINSDRIAGLGAGQRAILGSNNSGVASWVTGGNNQLLGTDGSGNLAFYPNAPFFNGTGTSGRISRWDGAGTAFVDANLNDDNVDISVENGLGFRFGAGSRISAIRSDADGGVRDSGTADDETAVTELAVRSAIDANVGATALSDNQIPVASGGSFVASNLTDDGGSVTTALNFNLAPGTIITSNGTSIVNADPITGNSFFGPNSGTAITSGSANVFVGNNTGSATTTGTGNLYIGNNAGIVSTGDGNAFVGTAAGQSNTSGSFNTFVGESAGNTNLTGTQLSLLGTSADVTVDGLTNATAVGTGARVAQSNSLVLGNNVYVGIGNTAPADLLTITASQAGEAVSLESDGAGNMLGLNFWDGDNTDYTGFVAPNIVNTSYELEMPADLPSVDGQLLSSNTSGVLSWATPAGISADNGLNVNGADIELGGALNINTDVDINSNRFRFMNGANEIIRLAPNNNVGIGTSGAASTKLQVSNNTATTAPIISVTQTGAGDSGIGLGLTGQSFILGIDASDGDLFRINSGTSLGASDDFYISAGGDVSLTGNGVGTVFMAGGNVRIDPSGDIYSIKGVGYSWPVANASGALSNDGAGNLSWSSVPTSASNGLSLVGTDLRLGGALTSATTITQGGNNLTISGGTVITSNSTVNNTLTTAGGYWNTDEFYSSTSDFFFDGTGIIGTSAQGAFNTLDIEGSLAVGTNYSGSIAAPANGMIVEGRMGIGTSAPNTMLNISATDNSGDLRLDDTLPFIFMNSTAGSNSGIQFWNNGSNAFDMYFAHSADRFYFNNIASGGDVEFVIEPNSIGINESTPVNFLDVGGGTVIGSSYSGTNTAPTNGLLVQGNVGIATTAPGATFEVGGGSGSSSAQDGYVNFGPSTGLHLTFDNNEVQAKNTPSNFNTFFVNYWGGDVNVGNGGLYYDRDLNSVSIAGAPTNTGVPLVLPTVATNWAMRIYQQNSSVDHWYLGVRSSDGARFHGFNGAYRGAFDATTGNYTPSSDRRLKKNFEELGVVLPDLMKLKPQYYHMETQEDSERKNIGFVAQELLEVYPEFVSGSEEDFYGVNYAGMVTVAIKAIQEQQKQIEEQKAEIEALKAQLSASNNVKSESAENKSEIESLKAELAAIKALLLNGTTKEDK